MKYFRDFDLTNFNAYRIHSLASEAYLPESESELIALLSSFSERKFHLIGSGHNIVLSRSYYSCPFIILGSNYSRFSVANEKIYALSGARMEDLAEHAAVCSLTGIEAFVDIPSSLGGAIVMNAGNAEMEISNVINDVTFYCLESLECKVFNCSEVAFGYRSSVFQGDNSKVILSANMYLQEGSQADIVDAMAEIKRARWAKQPREYPNCGSVFKRPPGYYVGTMIESLGLKGATLGGAQISCKHAGFIVNKGGATGADILGLIELAQAKVYAEYGVELEVEQRVI